MALNSECAITHGNAPTICCVSDSSTSEVVARVEIKLAPVPEAAAVEAQWRSLEPPGPPPGQPPGQPQVAIGAALNQDR